MSRKAGVGVGAELSDGPGPNLDGDRVLLRTVAATDGRPQIDHVAPGSLLPWPGNPNTHPDAQVQILAAARLAVAVVRRLGAGSSVDALAHDVLA